MTDTSGAWVRNSELHAVAMDDDVVMLVPDRDEYVGLSGVAARVWQLLEDPMTVPTICAHVLAEYDVEPGPCRTDIEDYVGQLVRHGLVVRSDVGSQ